MSNLKKTRLDVDNEPGSRDFDQTDETSRLDKTETFIRLWSDFETLTRP